MIKKIQELLEEVDIKHIQSNWRETKLRNTESIKSSSPYFSLKFENDEKVFVRSFFNQTTEEVFITIFDGEKEFSRLEPKIANKVLFKDFKEVKNQKQLNKSFYDLF